MYTYQWHLWLLSPYILFQLTDDDFKPIMPMNHPYDLLNTEETPIGIDSSSDEEVRPPLTDTRPFYYTPDASPCSSPSSTPPRSPIPPPMWPRLYNSAQPRPRKRPPYHDPVPSPKVKSSSPERKRPSLSLKVCVFPPLTMR